MAIGLLGHGLGRCTTRTAGAATSTAGAIRVLHDAQLPRRPDPAPARAPLRGAARRPRSTRTPRSWRARRSRPARCAPCRASASATSCSTCWPSPRRRRPWRACASWSSTARCTRRWRVTPTARRRRCWRCAETGAEPGARLARRAVVRDAEALHPLLDGLALTRARARRACCAPPRAAGAGRAPARRAAAVRDPRAARTASRPRRSRSRSRWARPGEPVLRYLSDLRGVRLEVDGRRPGRRGRARRRRRSGRRSRRRCGASSTARCRAATRSCARRSSWRASVSPPRPSTWTCPAGGSSFSTRRGRRERGAVRVAQPRHPHRRRAGAGRGEPPAAGGARSASSPTRVAMGWQVHGTDIVDWAGRRPAAAATPRRAPSSTKVDGHATRARPRRCWCWWPTACRSRWSAAGRAAMLHCGWRPLAGGIVEKARRARSGRAARGARSGPGSAAAATRWARRC